MLSTPFILAVQLVSTSICRDAVKSGVSRAPEAFEVGKPEVMSEAAPGAAAFNDDNDVPQTEVNDACGEHNGNFDTHSSPSEHGDQKKAVEPQGGKGQEVKDQKGKSQEDIDQKVKSQEVKIVKDQNAKMSKVWRPKVRRLVLVVQRNVAETPKDPTLVYRKCQREYKAWEEMWYGPRGTVQQEVVESIKDTKKVTMESHVKLHLAYSENRLVLCHKISTVTPHPELVEMDAHTGKTCDTIPIQPFLESCLMTQTEEGRLNIPDSDLNAEVSATDAAVNDSPRNTSLEILEDSLALDHLPSNISMSTAPALGKNQTAHF